MRSMSTSLEWAAPCCLRKASRGKNSSEGQMTVDGCASGVRSASRTTADPGASKLLAAKLTSAWGSTRCAPDNQQPAAGLSIWVLISWRSPVSCWGDSLLLRLQIQPRKALASAPVFLMEQRGKGSDDLLCSQCLSDNVPLVRAKESNIKSGPNYNQDPSAFFCPQHTHVELTLYCPQCCKACCDQCRQNGCSPPGPEGCTDPNRCIPLADALLRRQAMLLEQASAISTRMRELQGSQDRANQIKRKARDRFQAAQEGVRAQFNLLRAELARAEAVALGQLQERWDAASTAIEEQTKALGIILSRGEISESYARQLTQEAPALGPQDFFQQADSLASTTSAFLCDHTPAALETETFGPVEAALPPVRADPLRGGLLPVEWMALWGQWTARCVVAPLANDEHLVIEPFPAPSPPSPPSPPPPSPPPVVERPTLSGPRRFNLGAASFVPSSSSMPPVSPSPPIQHRPHMPPPFARPALPFAPSPMAPQPYQWTCTLTAHTDWVHAVAFIPPGSDSAPSASSDPSSAQVPAPCFPSGLVISGGEEAVLRMWDLAEMRQLQSVDVGAPVRAVAVASWGPRRGEELGRWAVAVGCADGRIMLYPAVESLTSAHTAQARLAYRATAARGDATAWPLAVPSARTLCGPEAAGQGLAGRADGAKTGPRGVTSLCTITLGDADGGLRLVSTHWDGTARVWSLPEGRLLGAYGSPAPGQAKLPTAALHSCVRIPSAPGRFATITLGGILKIWDIRSAPGHCVASRSLVASTPGGPALRVAVTGMNCGVVSWASASAGAQTPVISARPALAVATSDGLVQLFDLTCCLAPDPSQPIPLSTIDLGAAVPIPEGGRSPYAMTLAFTPPDRKGTHILMGDGRGNIHVYSLSAPAEQPAYLACLAGHQGSVKALTVGAIDNRTTFFSGSLDKTIRVWASLQSTSLR
ncbi:hypothetical protein PAPYR_2540 [Paratrimastix pyriformis]|uniref:B box-type domain-containing protein n=1 Tax=Paratrimastix pyriformis TaxID=342808 RepID=A0ABQ8UPJ4_9EUKA|nr:hypothetical protein PAPYR_2540 [Paratrimastix pyriformis]